MPRKRIVHHSVMQSEAIRTYNQEDRMSVEVISHGASLFVRMAFDDPKAVVRNIEDEHGKTYIMVKNSRPTVSNLEWRCFSLTEQIPLGRKFTGELVVNDVTCHFDGEAVNWQPAFGVAGGDVQSSNNPFKYLTWLPLLLGVVLILGIWMFVHNASRSGDTESSGRTVDSPEHGVESPAERVVDAPAERVVEAPAERVVEAPAARVVEAPAERTGRVVEKPVGNVEKSSEHTVERTGERFKNDAASSFPESSDGGASAKPVRQKRPGCPSLSDATFVQSNGVYSITNERDISAVADKIGNSGKSGIVLVFCPDRYTATMRPSQYQRLWSDLAGKVKSSNIKEVEVIKPAQADLRVDEGLLRDKGIGIAVKEMK